MVQYYQQNNGINYISCTNMPKIIFDSNDTYVYSFHPNKELVWSDLGRNGKLILSAPLVNVLNFRKSFFKISTFSFVLRMI